MRYADRVKNYEGPNPFSDNQARNFSDDKVNNEFYPTSGFWSLFNDQHEILVGTRGCGKTFLLKMMRYSMLKRLDHPNAKSIINKKDFIALYVPMHLEFVEPITNITDEKKSVAYFQFAFNCTVSKALLNELDSLTDECADQLHAARQKLDLARALDRCWFGEASVSTNSLKELSQKVQELYYTTDISRFNANKIPAVFLKHICTPLIISKDIIYNMLQLQTEPTWLVCIDEAEFLNAPLQRCINTVFRSDSNRIALKVATLPFYHITLETLNPGITVSNENDFSYRVVDLAFDSNDFIHMTDKLCRHRLKTRFDNTLECDRVEDFLGKVGNDDMIDYYRKEVGEKAAIREEIESRIIESFSEKRRKNASEYPNRRKTVYDKFAPVYFTREMCNLSRIGNRTPGWYAGALMVRKLSQGNPRLFIQIMHKFFEHAQQNTLTPKAQHRILLKFADDFCKSTEALEKKGPEILSQLTIIASTLSEKAHNGPLIACGSAFRINYSCDTELDLVREWMEIAIAYSRVQVDNKIKTSRVGQDTKYLLSNLFSANYWIPFRGEPVSSITLNTESPTDPTYEICPPNGSTPNSIYQQLSFFSEFDDED